jgi:ankyrin repeat protein
MKILNYTQNLVIIALFLGLFSACDPKNPSTSPSGTDPFSTESGPSTATASSTASLSKLISAIKNKEIQEAKKIIATKRVNLNDKDPEGYTPLHYAAIYGQKEIGEDLLNNGARIDEPESTLKRTALHYAAMAGELELAKLLLAKGANINAQDDKFQLTPLHLAYMHHGKNAPIVQELIKAPAIDVTLKDSKGEDAAKWNDFYEASMNSFIPQGLPENSTKAQALLAVLFDQTAFLRKLLAQRPQLSSDTFSFMDNNTLLMAAVKANKEPLIKMLLEAGANPKEVNPTTGQSAISMALGDYKLAKFLKDNGVTFSPDEEKEFKELAKDFLQRGDITTDDVKDIIKKYPDLLDELEKSQIENVFFTRISDETDKDNIDRLFAEFIKKEALDANKTISLMDYLGSQKSEYYGIRKGLINLLDTIPALDQEEADELLYESFGKNHTYDDNHLKFIEKLIKKGANINAEFGLPKARVLERLQMIGYEKGKFYLNMYINLLNKGATAREPVELLTKLADEFSRTYFDNVPNKEALGKEIAQKIVEQITHDNEPAQLDALKKLKKNISLRSGLTILGLI